jgi:hypothetical protein
VLIEVCLLKLCFLESRSLLRVDTTTATPGGTTSLTRAAETASATLWCHRSLTAGAAATAPSAVAIDLDPCGTW